MTKQQITYNFYDETSIPAKQLYVKEPQLYIIGPDDYKDLKCVPISVGVTNNPIDLIQDLQKTSTPKLKYYNLIQRENEETCYLALLSIFDNVVVQGEEWIEVNRQILSNLKKNKLISTNIKTRISNKLDELGIV